MQSSRIRAEVQMDSHVMVPRNRKSVKIQAVAVIHNDSDDHFVLGAPDAASAHGWQILDADGKEIARHAAGKKKKKGGRTEPFVSSMVPSKHSVRENESVEVDAAKLKHGARYTLRHNHWGYIGEAEFVVVHAPEVAAAPKKKAAKAKRKAAKKAAVKAKPKAAKKKAAAKAKPKAAKKAAPKKKKAAAKKKARKTPRKR